MDIKKLKEGDLPYILLYVVLVHVFFYKLLVPGQMVFGTDTISQSYPLQVMGIREILNNHSVPLWDPYMFAGMPLLASFSFHIFYPWSLLYFITSTEFALGYLYIVHFLLMGVFFFYFARQIKLSRPASFVGGLIFMFGPHLTSLVYPGHGGKIFTMTYLPLALMFLDRALDERPFFNMSLLGLTVGLMFYAGHIQILFYCGITLLLFLLMRLAAGLRGKKDARWALKGAAGFVYAFGLGTLLYAVILIPAWEYKGYTQRSGGMTAAATYEFATSFSMPPEDLLYTVLREPFGWGKDYGPTIPTTDGIFYRGRMGLKLSVDYLGVFGLLLALIGAVFRRNRYTWYFVGLGLITVFLALGGFNPLYYYVYKFVPGFSMFRIPYAIMILTPLCCSVLAAFGMDYLLTGREAVKGKGLSYFIYAAAGATVVLLAVAVYCRKDVAGTAEWFLRFEWVKQMLWGVYDDLPERFDFFLKNVFILATLASGSLLVLFATWKGWLKGWLLVIAASTFIIADLWPVGWEFIRTVPVSSIEDTYFRETPEIKTIEADKDGPFRVMSLVTNNELLFRGIQSLTGYHAVPLDYSEKMLGSIDFQNSILDLLNGKYLMLPKEPQYDFYGYPDLATRAWLMKKYELISDGDMYFYKNRSPLPRAYLVNRFIRAGNLDEAGAIIADPRFKPLEAAVLTEDPEPGMSVDQSADLSGQKVSMTSYKPDSAELDVSAPADSFMVASEIWYPGWKAYVDGSPTRLYRVDYALRGFAMPKGSHKVRMVFSPRTFSIGAIISMATLAFLAAAMVFSYRKGRDIIRQ